MSEAGTDDEGDTLELAYSYEVNGKYPPGCDVNKKRSIRRKAEKIIVKNGEAWTKRKMNGTTKSNGLDERYNQTLQRMLSKAVMGHKDMWDQFIDSSVFAYNTSTHESTHYTPFEVMFGRRARLPIDADLESICEHSAEEPNTASPMEDVSILRQSILKNVKHNILVAQAKQKQQYDAKHARASVFEIGAKVVKKDFLWKKRKGGKLDPKWVGPYIITAKLSKGFYSLQCVANSSDRVKRVNGTHLKVFNSSESQSCSNSPQHSNQSSPHQSNQFSPHQSNQSSPHQSKQSSPHQSNQSSPNQSNESSPHQPNHAVFTLSIRNG
ncbi:hypothetical protein EMCRGX_G012215 [Ephydatia muelleri]|eukprot:Em0006g278a